MIPRPLKTALSCLLLISFVHFGYAQTGTISFSIASPLPGNVEDSNAYIQANLITSTYTINSVVASVQGRNLSLTSAGRGVYYGTLSLGGLPAGVTDTVTIVFTDINGNSQAASAPFIYDPKPTVTIVKPYETAVGRPTIDVQGSCKASAGHCQLTVSFKVPTQFNPVVVGTFTDSVNTTFDVSAYQGLGEFQMQFNGVDQYNVQGSDARDFYVETSPYLTPVYTANNPISGFLANKVLVVPTLNADSPRIVNVTNRAATAIPYRGVFQPYNGVFITTPGAVFLGANANNSPVLYDWNNGQLDSAAPGAGSLNAKGNYCFWTNNNTSAWYRDLTTHTTQLLVADPSGIVQVNDASASGVIAYSDNGRVGDSVLLYQNGVPTAIRIRPVDTLLSQPVTDGINAAYYQQDRFGNLTIYRYDGNTGTNTLLSSLGNSTQNAAFNSTKNFYLVNNGYTAFLQPDANWQYQGWIRDQTGNLTQATTFPKNSTIETLSSNGQLSFFNSIVSNGLRYIYNKSGTTGISQAAGNSFWQDSDSSWYVAIGNTLFRVNLNISADRADSFSVNVKEDSLFTFSSTTFTSHYHTSGSLVNVIFTRLPSHGNLKLNGTPVTTNQGYPASSLSALVYTPLINFAGSDTVVWTGSNGYTASPAGALLVINVDSVLPTPPPAPVISGLWSGYCSSRGTPVTFTITNMPIAGTGTTVVATLDGQPLSVESNGVTPFNPWTLTVGSHTVAVIFSNSLGADTTSAIFQIVPASTPKVTLAANPSTLTTSTQQVVLTATDVSGGGTAPLYTFFTNYSLTLNTLQAESSSNTLTIPIASLTVGRNVIYVNMTTSDTCYTQFIGTDSIVLVRVQDTAVLPPAPKISGLMAAYCQNAGSQQVGVSNMPAAGSGVTVSGTLDGQPVTVSSAGAITLQPQTLSLGTHSLAVIFSDAAGSDTTTGNFRIDTVITPVVKLTFTPDPITTTTPEFELVATPVVGGSGIPPLFTFFKYAIGSPATLQAQGGQNTTTISVASLSPGNNVFFVQMSTFDSCATTHVAFDSIVIVKPVDTTSTPPPSGHVTVGPNPFTGTVTLKNLDPNKSYEIKLTNAFGQVLITQVVEGQTQAVLLTSDLLRGVYFLRVYDLGTGKVVKAAVLLSANR